MSDDDLKAELESLRRENAALKKGASDGIRMKVNTELPDQPAKLDATSLVGCGSAPFAGDHSRELAGTSERLVGVETRRAAGLQASRCVICDIRNQNL